MTNPSKNKNMWEIMHTFLQYFVMWEYVKVDHSQYRVIKKKISLKTESLPFLFKAPYGVLEIL